MQFINSSLGLDDNILIDDINYFSIPGESFTPGVGGTYKGDTPPFKPPLDEKPQWQDTENSPGCEQTLTAGWRTHDFCSPKQVECGLKRRHEPHRRIDPGRLQLQQYILPPGNTGVSTTENIINHDIKEIVIIVLILYILYTIIVR